MKRTQLAASIVLATGAAAIAAPSALAGSPGGNHGCNGQIVAETNHFSGLFGASGNPNASAGPGYFFRSENTADAIQFVRSFCP